MSNGRDLTSGLDAAMKTRTAMPPRVVVQSHGAKSAVASLEVQRLQREIQSLKDAAVNGAQGMLLDAKTVKHSPWANRSAKSFLTADFAELREKIKLTKGNVQAGCVYLDESGEWVLIFGHRRHRACLDESLPFRAVALEMEGVDPKVIFEVMFAENEGRKSLSIWEQGVSFDKAIADGMYESNRELGKALGVSHTWVSVCRSCSSLPDVVLNCWDNLTNFKEGDLSLVVQALKEDEQAVLTRAEKISDVQRQYQLLGDKAPHKRLPDSKIALHLAYEDGVTRDEKPRALTATKYAKPFGKFKRNAKGVAILELDPAFTRDEAQQLIAFAQSIAAKKKQFQDDPKIKIKAERDQRRADADKRTADLIGQLEAQNAAEGRKN